MAGASKKKAGTPAPAPAAAAATPDEALRHELDNLWQAIEAEREHRDDLRVLVEALEPVVMELGRHCMPLRGHPVTRELAAVKARLAKPRHVAAN